MLIFLMILILIFVNLKRGRLDVQFAGSGLTAVENRSVYSVSKSSIILRSDGLLHLISNWKGVAWPFVLLAYDLLEAYSKYFWKVLSGSSSYWCAKSEASLCKYADWWMSVVTEVPRMVVSLVGRSSPHPLHARRGTLAQKLGWLLLVLSHLDQRKTEAPFRAYSFAVNDWPPHFFFLIYGIQLMKATFGRNVTAHRITNGLFVFTIEVLFKSQFGTQAT